MMSLCCKVLKTLEGKTLATAESCTGGMIGAAITAVAGSSSVYKGAVSAYVAEAMACGARNALEADVAISVTGLAGPGGDDFGNPVGTVYIGYADALRSESKYFLFSGDRDQVRKQAMKAALQMILDYQI